MKGTGRYGKYYNLRWHGHKKIQHKIAIHFPGHEEIVEFSVNTTARDIKRMVKKDYKAGSGPS